MTVLYGPSIASAEDIALFFNSTYVDTQANAAGEAYTLQQTLIDKGHTVTTFTGINDTDWASAFDANHLVMIPELEAGNLDAALSSAARTTIADKVSQGHGLVMFGHGGSNDRDFLNGTFGLSLIDGSSYISGQSISRTAAATGTPFAAAPATILGTNGTYTTINITLPAGYNSMYSIGSDSAVFTNSGGNLVFMAYDWNDAMPVGTQDSGWLSVLDAAITSAALIGGGDWTGVADGPTPVIGPDGNWSTGGNWSGGGTPSSTDDADFTLADTYDVTFTGNEDANNVTVAAGAVTFDLGGHRLDIAGQLKVGETAGTDQLTITNGTLRTLGTGMDLIGGNGSTGRLIIDNATVQMVNSSRLRMGESFGTSELQVVNGGSLDVNLELNMADVTNADDATALVDGAGSTLTVGRFLIVGDVGDAAVTVSDGGMVQTTDPTGRAEIARTGGTTATVTIQDATSTLHVAGDMYVGGTSSASGGAGTVNVSGGSVDVDGTLKVWNASSAVNLASGTLKVDTLDLAGDAARLNWTGGTLHLDGTGVVGLGGALTMPDDSTLKGTGTVDGQIIVAADASVTIEAQTVLDNTHTFNVHSGATVDVTAGTVRLGGLSASASSNNGTIIVQDGATFDNEDTSGIYAPGGKFTLAGGTIGGYPLLQSADGSTLIVGHGTLNAAVNLYGTAGLVADGGVLDVGAALGGGGTVSAFDDGTLNLNLGNGAYGAVALLRTSESAGGTVNLGNDFAANQVIIGDNGTLDLGGYTLTTAAIGNDVTLRGLLKGSGTIIGDVAHDASTISPGDSVGEINITGDLAPAAAPPATNLAVIELQGEAAGQFDTINVTGHAHTIGDVQISLLGGYVPEPFADTFAFMTYGSRTGTFDDIINNTGYPGLMFDIIYNANEAVLTVEALPGDANLDGTVNALDLSLLASNWQDTGLAWMDGDFNADGSINALDLSVLASNWLASANGGVTFDDALASVNLSGIPEPTSLMLLAGGAGVLLARRRGMAARSAARRG